jgi:hypothetical protein
LTVGVDKVDVEIGSHERYVHVVVPPSSVGLRSMLLAAIEEAGGYAFLAAKVCADDPDLV